MDTLIENWLLLGETSYYMKYHYFNMGWDIEDLSDYFFAHEQYGGSLAVISKNPSKQRLMIFSAAGRLICHKDWKDAAVIGLHWSEDERLFLLQRSGLVAILKLNGDYVKYIKMGEKVKGSGVKSFRFFTTLVGTGLIMLAETNDFFYKTNIMDSNDTIVQIRGAKNFFSEPTIDWVALLNSDKNVVVMYAHKSEIILFENGKTQVYGREYEWNTKMNTTGSYIIRMAVTLSYQNLAIISSNGIVWILKCSDLSCILSSYDLNFTFDQKQYLQMEWAGEDFLALYYNDRVYFMDIYNQKAERLCIEEPLMFPEIDGVRLITTKKHEFVQKIQSELQQLYEINSNSPSATLFDAQQHLEENLYTTVRLIEHIKSNPNHMKKAIDGCLTAASYCLEPRWQKTILKAVRLGRSFLPDYKSDRVSEVHNKLLLLNNLKLPFVAMPVTLVQLEQMTMTVLIDRLINRGYYPFVERLCYRLRIPRELGLDRMLHHWAELIITSTSSNKKKQSEEAELAENIIQRLHNHKGFDFARIAQLSVKSNKLLIAEKLLEQEVRVDQKVRILLEMGKHITALNKAIESGNSELISFVVSKLHSKLKREELQVLIDKIPIAKTILYEIVLTPKQLEEFRGSAVIDNNSPVSEIAEYKVKCLVASNSIQSAINGIPAAQDSYKRIGNDFVVQALNEEKQILIHMSTTIKDSTNNENFNVFMSFYDYISYLFDQKLDEKAESFGHKLRGSGGLTERQLCYLKLRSYVRRAEWEELDKILGRWGVGINSSNSGRRGWTGSSVKLPISFGDLAELIVTEGSQIDPSGAEAQFRKLADRVEPERRVRILVSLEQFSQAEELARSIRNDYLIGYVAAMKFSIA